ncbi:flagellar protein FlaG [Alkalilimnicola ehrlichii MLHE-1]|uniref:Flagellar protein FlaG protein n=1 Tax=Alkalilimnicola ehrlichii (strain ATCC BAA-1101 / DSM 17681 / MLHE-1) TaxID=187272 RepID=Q0AAT1_ALKEH|nr:flagellar protein FlaG [Alkalilimnicola ehrlichii]ABI56056.1 flagellar protein FlaG protein [Alkalilimnicola ehrlichii MLHE-1]
MDGNSTVTTPNLDGIRAAVARGREAVSGAGARPATDGAAAPRPASESAPASEPARDPARAEDPRRGTDPTAEEVGEAVDRINEFVQLVQRDLEFSIDEDTGRTVVKVFDSQSEELVRQFPPEEILAIAEHLEELKGLLVREQA